jgi:hypothetical protein
MGTLARTLHNTGIRWRDSIAVLLGALCSPIIEHYLLPGHFLWAALLGALGGLVIGWMIRLFHNLWLDPKRETAEYVTHLEQSYDKTRADLEQARRQIRQLSKPAVEAARLKLEPVYRRDQTGDHLRVGVTNLGYTDEFQAQIVGWSKGDGEPSPLKAPSTLSWVGDSDRFRKIPNGATEYLEIAQVEYGEVAPETLSMFPDQEFRGNVLISADWAPFAGSVFGKVSSLFASENNPWAKRYRENGITEEQFRAMCRKTGRDPETYAAEILGEPDNTLSFFHYSNPERFSPLTWTLRLVISPHQTAAHSQSFRITVFGRPEDDPLQKGIGALQAPVTRITRV